MVRYRDKSIGQRERSEVVGRGGAVSERVHMGDTTGINVMLPRTSRTSRRCRATHDIPWSERCILDMSHVWTADTPMHKDKGGRSWIDE